MNSVVGSFLTIIGIAIAIPVISYMVPYLVAKGIKDGLSEYQKDQKS